MAEGGGGAAATTLLLPVRVVQAAPRVPPRTREAEQSTAGWLRAVQRILPPIEAIVRLAFGVDRLGGISERLASVVCVRRPGAAYGARPAPRFFIRGGRRAGAAHAGPEG